MSYIFIKLISCVTVSSTGSQLSFITIPSCSFKNICYSNIHCLVCHRLDGEFAGSELGGPAAAVGDGDDDSDCADLGWGVLVRGGDFGA